MLKSPPAIQLDLIEELESSSAPGFLRLRRKLYRARFPDGQLSESFLYDSVARRAMDAVILFAHFRRGGEQHVYLRSALRPPLTEQLLDVGPSVAGVDGNVWEVPAGLVEPGEEEIRLTGARELREELGFTYPIERFQALGPPVYPAAALIGERQFFLQIEVNPEHRREPELDGSPLEEGAAIVELPLRAALEACRAGQIPDAKSELGLRRLADQWLAPAS